ncbi:hypothetical protein [cf. Phormidesmis sp. LEGE 11477]|uniref:hypothetical protein n=1 Tax=cf. Phormidesmis sp. LEGE 11477 TaxID=1828680 RepID=UPI0018826CC1|nr:hypothetical protein [cf. Phormidesmis sp. LEGE 11477]MBE9064955.1 hypothetical protein [cf. Phormidesmis sp. LEGE 11477]
MRNQLPMAGLFVVLGVGLTLAALGIVPAITELGFAWSDLKDWQTLMTGLLIIAAAGLAYGGVWHQVRAANRRLTVQIDAADRSLRAQIDAADRRLAAQMTAERTRQEAARVNEAVAVATAFASEFRVKAFVWEAASNSILEELDGTDADFNANARSVLKYLLGQPKSPIFESHIGKIGVLPTALILRVVNESSVYTNMMSVVDHMLGRQERGNLTRADLGNLSKRFRNHERDANDVADQIEKFIATL